MEESIRNIRRRSDFTEQLKPSERRLDSLAKLLAGNSTCVAVAIIDGTCYIAANELQVSSKNNQCIRAINTIMSELRMFSNQTQTSSALGKRREIFQLICKYTPARVKRIIQSGELIIPDDFPEKIADAILDNPDHFDISLEEDYRGYSLAAWIVYGLQRSLYRDFLKLTDSISADSINKNEATYTVEELQAFRKEHQVLKRESKGDVHAEVQILSYILQAYNEVYQKEESFLKHIYIGISKLCCLKCRAMLEVANEVFHENGIQIIIETRGQHDLNFDNWKCPDSFLVGYDKISVDEDTRSSIAYQIGFRGKEKIEQLLSSEKIKEKVRMEHSPSGSEAEDLIAKMQEIFMNVKGYLNTLLARKMHNNFSNPALDSEIDNASIVVKIYKLRFFLKGIEPFLLGSEEDDTSNEELHKQIKRIQLGYQEEHSVSISIDKLLELLSDPVFFGEEIARIFGHLKESTDRAKLSLSIDLPESVGQPTHSVKRSLSSISLEGLSKRSRLEEETTKTSADELLYLASKGLFGETQHIKLIEEAISNRHLCIPDGLIYQEIAGDGHCLYNAVGIYLGAAQETLRSIVATHIEDHLDEFYDFITVSPKQTIADYIAAVKNRAEWASHIEIEVLMRVLNRPIVVIDKDGNIFNKAGIFDEEENIRFPGQQPIFVYYNGHNHYDALLLNHDYNQHGIELLNRLLTQSTTFSEQQNKNSP